jgi:hypothetical protein
MKFGRFLYLVLAACSLALTVSASPAAAVTGADWKPGRIMDDSVFYNEFSMSVSHIQQFLNAKTPTCDRWGTEPSEFGGGTRAQYGAAHGNPAPYTCLKDYYENTTTKENNLEGRGIPAGAKSAAQIIWDAGQTYDINPQVIIALIQKEQTLVTDEWPFPRQYRSATGYGCPDSTGCNSLYYGFYNQVRNAARQFRLYANNPNNFNHVPHQNNFIRWSPNTACGGRNVFIENQATASLYNYTPYQPNAAALNNLRGTGDSCSAYGNRNFWRIFNDWFGSTLGKPYGWHPIDKRSYTDNTKTVGIHESKLVAGQPYYLQIKARNTGNVTWSKSIPDRRVNVITSHATGRRSPFCTSTWINDPNPCNRPTSMIENEVEPGEVATFEFWIRAPQQSGVYDEHFSLIMDGTALFNDPGLYWHFTVAKALHRWEPVEKRSFIDDDETTGIHESRLVAGQRYYLRIKARNTGNVPWTKEVKHKRVNAITAHALGRKSPFCDTTWINDPVHCDRPTSMLETEVLPGQVGTFKFWIKAPTQPGTYDEHYSLIMDGTATLNDPGLYWHFKVNP